MVSKMRALKRINLWRHISYKENAVLERMLKILCSLSHLTAFEYNFLSLRTAKVVLKAIIEIKLH